MAEPTFMDDALIRVYRKIRDARAASTTAYKLQYAKLTGQMEQIERELLSRFNTRGQTSSKTDEGTAFRVINVKATIANELLFEPFVLETGDLEFYQRRIKLEHLAEYMKQHQGEMPPGLTVHREFGVNVRAPSKGKTSGEPPEGDAYEAYQPPEVEGEHDHG